jgi:D-alanine--poly(phosphoribitol) ligase subunit 2
MIETLRQMILEELMIGQDELLNDDEELLLSGRIDSLGIVRLIALIEEDFQIHIPPEDVIIENFMTLQAIASYLEVRIAVEKS